jgi:hypothetical protein
MGLRIVPVDPFTAQPFHGNPAAVCILAAPHPVRLGGQAARVLEGDLVLDR